ncbi:His-Xaa-Ser repeat protein HxsA2 [Uliginosibacterium sp. TH139]|uniref:His-Xaa-Ser repeat protein HxsA2 n=1 Tax=Uliginosibacterium sp. TH139 TaxID=2067453 RepID=UPI000C7CCBB3|nr:His-Xaa-Ser repeat protein HxsA2 [Uliginosibacterium sp. TH139]PLK48310.1 hypothetical protein C0V76_13910 [Uliginosibacterium sp. TH139]
MKKFSFFVPVTMAAAALTGEAAAKLESAPSAASEKPTTATQEGASRTLGFTQSFYAQQGELHSLMVKPTGTGQMFAYHHSHASHASHASHYSHRSAY